MFSTALKGATRLSPVLSVNAAKAVENGAGRLAAAALAFDLTRTVLDRSSREAEGIPEASPVGASEGKTAASCLFV